MLVASGRPFEIARELCAGIPFTAPQISYNGAVVYDPVADRASAQTFMPEMSVLPVVRYLLDAGIPPIVCASGAAYVADRVHDADAWVPPALRPGLPLGDLTEDRASTVIKIAGESDSAHISRLRPRAEAEFGRNLYVTQTGPTLLEFLHPGVSKGAALGQIARTLAVPREQVIAFGDSHNDLTMFGVAGLRVAMGNASDEVKAGADRIAPPNDRDGVAVVLEDLGLVDRWE